MNCGRCNLTIRGPEDIHWIEDIMVCTDCYAHETQEENEQ